MQYESGLAWTGPMSYASATEIILFVLLYHGSWSPSQYRSGSGQVHGGPYSTPSHFQVISVIGCQDKLVKFTYSVLCFHSPYYHFITRPYITDSNNNNKIVLITTTNLLQKNSKIANKANRINIYLNQKSSFHLVKSNTDYHLVLARQKIYTNHRQILSLRIDCVGVISSISTGIELLLRIHACDLYY